MVLNTSLILSSKAYNFIKKESLVQVLSCESCEISKNTFFKNTSGRLLLLFPHKTAYSSKTSYNVYKNPDGNSKVYISTKVHFLKIDFLKTTGIAKDVINVSVILANKYEAKAKNFIIPISVYGN